MADRSPKEKVQVEPQPKNPQLVGWLEGLFYGPGDYPQRVEVRTMQGNRLGDLVKQVIYPPNMVDPADRGESDDKPESGKVSEKRKAKPNREELVELSHDIIRRVQIDADARHPGKSVVYYVLASHDARDPQPYERYPLRVKGAELQDPASEDSEEMLDGDLEGVKGVKSLQKAFLLGMIQNQKMFDMLGAMIEGTVDRQDRTIARLEEQVVARDTQIMRNHEVVARAMDIGSERKMREQTHELRMDAIKRGMTVFESFVAPQILPALFGKTNGSGIQESPESLTLKAFLKPVEEGGRLTPQQVDAVFGAFDETPEQNLIRPGVLSIDQGKIIYNVANLHVPATEIEKLLPGAEFGLTQEQIVALQGVFKETPDQIIPIVGMIGMVMQRVQQRKQQQAQNQQTSA